jgi:exonuclease III
MKETLWISVREESSSHLEICVGFIYNAPLNSCWYNPNFTRELEGEINGLRDAYPESEFLLLGDMNSRVRTLQVNLPHRWDTLENVDKEFNTYGSRLSKDVTCNTKGKKLIEFFERNTFEILNGKYGADTNGEYTFINQAGKSVIDYAVVSEGLINKLVEFKIGNEIISCHMPLLVELGDTIQRKVVELGDTIQRKVGTKATVRKTAHKLVKYRWDERGKL